jgi:hypothetical protein
MYSRLLATTPGVTAGDLDLLFKDQSFGAAPGDEARTYSPRAGLRIVQDRSFGVAPRLRHDARNRDLRPRLRRRGGPAVLHGRPAPLRTRPAQLVRRRRRGQPRDALSRALQVRPDDLYADNACASTGRPGDRIQHSGRKSGGDGESDRR